MKAQIVREEHTDILTTVPQVPDWDPPGVYRVWTHFDGRFALTEKWGELQYRNFSLNEWE